MAATKHRINIIEPLAVDLSTLSLKRLFCEVRRHPGQQPVATFCLSYEYLGGKHKQAIVRVCQPACLSCAVSFARRNDLPIPPRNITLRQKLKEVKVQHPAWGKGIFGLSPDEYAVRLKNDLCELVELVEVTYGL